MREGWTNSDHDTLIEIRTLVGELKSEIKDLKDGTHLQLADHDRRIRGIEETAIRQQIDERVKKYDKTVFEWSDFKSKVKVYLTMATAAGGFLAWLLNLIFSEFITRRF